MRKNVLNVLDLLQNFNKSTFLENEYLNLPDLSFYNKCNEQYRINRGVYNSIDNWFYEYGVINIMFRRIYILAFLEFVKKENNELNSQKFIKFGHGGLAIKLKEFTSKYTNNYYVTSQLEQQFLH
jgi:hypothetical protein